MLRMLWSLFNLICLIVLAVIGLYCTWIGLNTLLYSTQYDKATAYLVGAIMVQYMVSSSRRTVEQEKEGE